MTEATIEARIEHEPSLLRKFWNKGKWGVAALGLAYIFNGAYHGVMAINADEEFRCLQRQTELDVLGLFYKSDGWKEAGLNADEKHRRWESAFKKMVAADKRPETLRRRDYHLRKALNPFYE